MDKNEPMTGCALTCWLVAALGGVFVAAALILLGGWTFMQAIFAGIVLALIAGALLSWTMCKPLPGPGEAKISAPAPGPRADAKPAAAAPAAKAPEAPAPAEPAAAAKAPEAAPAPAAAAAASPLVKPSAALAGQAELASRKGEWKYQAPAAAAKPKAKAKPAAAKAAPAPAAAAEAKPALMDAPRGGTADDLKRIGGVGPKLEQTLNEMGIWHFDQVAGWGPDEIAWVDARLRFKGRIERDDWMSQAKVLAAGGETEFSRKKKG